MGDITFQIKHEGGSWKKLMITYAEIQIDQQSEITWKHYLLTNKMLISFVWRGMGRAHGLIQDKYIHVQMENAFMPSVYER